MYCACPRLAKSCLHCDCITIAVLLVRTAKSSSSTLLRTSLRVEAVYRFGTEHEKLGYNLSDHKRIDYNSIKALLEGLCSRFGWEPIMEGEYIIGAVLDGQSVTIEPGGQFELSGAPVDTLHKTCSEVNSHLYQVQNVIQPEFDAVPHLHV